MNYTAVPDVNSVVTVTGAPDNELSSGSNAISAVERADDAVGVNRTISGHRCFSKLRHMLAKYQFNGGAATADFRENSSPFGP
jgi:hypothetical protein